MEREELKKILIDIYRNTAEITKFEQSQMGGPPLFSSFDIDKAFEDRVSEMITFGINQLTTEELNNKTAVDKVRTNFEKFSSAIFKQAQRRFTPYINEIIFIETLAALCPLWPFCKD